MKSGFITVIGKANAGKSTLVNVLVGEKVAIVSPKPQTTRDRIMGVYNSDKAQIAFIDTPGIYKADNLLNSVMQKTSYDSVNDVDAILFVLDAHDGITDQDKNLVKKFASSGLPFVLALTKTDIMQESLLISVIKEFSACNFDVVPVSARKGKNVKELLKVLVSKLPDGDKIFGDDIISDRSERFMLSEIMREKILLKFDKEIPHGVAIIINKFAPFDNGKTIEVNLDIICEKPNHKAILIGKGGRAIKEVSSFARQDMEKFLGKKVFLTTYVKVKEDWRNSAGLLKEYGYSEQENS
jgi:GTP-binding protein Era